MGQETVLLRSSQSSDRATAAAFLRELAEKIESGKVILKMGTNEVSLELPERIKLKVKAEEETSTAGATKQKIEAEIQWIVGDAGPEKLSLG